MKIAVKYCGGCSPLFDRVETVKFIKGELGDMVEFTGPEKSDADLVLAIQGCDVACADLSSFDGKKIVSLASHEEAEIFVSDFREGMYSQDS